MSPVTCDAPLPVSALYTSRYAPDENWPNTTMPEFREQVYGQLKLSDGRALSFNPIIYETTCEPWEAHSMENVEILSDTSLIERAWETCRIVADGIFMVGGVDDTGLASGSRYNTTMVPVWQISPIEGNSKAVVFNLNSGMNRQRALDDMLYHKVPALTAILQLFQGSDLRPSSVLFSPVFNNFRKQLVVGSISIVFSWDDLLNKLLPSYINGIFCVIRTNIGQSYTFLVNGDDVSVIGKGDLHDPLYYSIIYTVD